MVVFCNLIGHNICISKRTWYYILVLINWRCCKTVKGTSKFTFFHQLHVHVTMLLSFENTRTLMWDRICETSYKTEQVLPSVRRVGVSFFRPCGIFWQLRKKSDKLGLEHCLNNSNTKVLRLFFITAEWRIDQYTAVICYK